MSDIELDLAVDELKRRMAISEALSNKAKSVTYFNLGGIFTSFLFIIFALLDGARENLFLATSQLISTVVMLLYAYSIYLTHCATRILVTGK